MASPAVEAPAAFRKSLLVNVRRRAVAPSGRSKNANAREDIRTKPGKGRRLDLGPPATVRMFVTKSGLPGHGFYRRHAAELAGFLQIRRGTQPVGVPRIPADTFGVSVLQRGD
jgi:hypothetical protein